MTKKGKIISKEENQKVRDKSSLSQAETNSLEQMIEKDKEKIDFSELKELLNEQKMQKSSPSLEKINAPQRNPIRLEKDLTETTSANNSNKEEDTFNYNAGGGKSDEAKYIKYEGMIIENITPHTEIQNIGRGNSLERREIGFENSPQAKISAQENFEKYSPVKNIDTDKLGKEKPFERKEIKYKPERY
jgi:hypothetical protein